MCVLQFLDRLAAACVADVHPGEFDEEIPFLALPRSCREAVQFVPADPAIAGAEFGVVERQQQIDAGSNVVIP